MKKIKQFFKKLYFFIRNNTPRFFEQGYFLIKENRNGEPEVNIILLGDITLAHRFNEKFERGDFKSKNPFIYCMDYFTEAVCMGNLEGTITEYNEKVPKQFNFKGKSEYLRFLKEANIHAVTLANNHILDFGERGLFDTLNSLDDYGILYTGAGKDLESAIKPVIIKQNGISIAVFSFDDIEPQFWANEKKTGTAQMTKESIKKGIDSILNSVDIIVVALHFGRELDQKPNERQKEFARFAIDCGAHIIAGSHPHVIQGVEQYKQGLIFYSLGNFCFGGNANPRDKDTFFPIITMEKEGILSYKIVPCRISSTDMINDCFPTPQKGNEKHRILKKIRTRI